MAENKFIKEAQLATRFEVKRYGYSLVFEISPDEVECHCFYEPSTTGGTPLTESELQGHLTQFKIKEGIVPESKASLLNSAASAKPVNGILLARGIRMVPGEDGQIIIGVVDDLEQSKPDEADNGTIDF
jgi:uncharacterized protein (DUF342 family)